MNIFFFSIKKKERIHTSTSPKQKILHYISSQNAKGGTNLTMLVTGFNGRPWFEFVAGGGLWVSSSPRLETLGEGRKEMWETRTAEREREEETKGWVMRYLFIYFCIIFVWRNFCLFVRNLSLISFRLFLFSPFLLPWSGLSQFGVEILCGERNCSLWILILEFILIFENWERKCSELFWYVNLKLSFR